MINHLKTIFPSFTLLEGSTILSSDYTWFITKHNEIFGIHEDELTDRDLTLLLSFVKKYDQTLPEKTVIERQWYDRIRKNPTETVTYPYRFVYFSIQKNQIKPIAFKEAITELFHVSTPILWESETNGIIVEEISIRDQEINYEHIIDILIADLSVDIKFFVGDIQHSYSHINRYYTTVLSIGHSIFQLTKKKVINHLESIPYLLIKQVDHQTKVQISSILKSFLHDEEMLHTIEMLLTHNLNVSETAKKMYMHRNSLQYRLDKFCNETGINLQDFDETVVVKLALLAKKMLKNN